ncbi:UNVERIFIED_CONTAM: hypothetical protein GTU68_063439, partial [Idotea baltica]|nr:hypothetical protein [Idotea baltica]
AEKNYITPIGFNSLQSEYNQLKKRERPQVVEVVTWAAGNGDRSENADYHYGKRRLREIDKRLRYLGKQIDAAEIIDPASVSSDKIVFGATVCIEDEEGSQKTYMIVGVDESEPERGKISWKSPIARALMKGRSGELISFNTPQGERDIEILSVEYKAIEG